MIAPIESPAERFVRAQRAHLRALVGRAMQARALGESAGDYAFTRALSGMGADPDAAVGALREAVGDYARRARLTGQPLERALTELEAILFADAEHATGRIAHSAGVSGASGATLAAEVACWCITAYTAHGDGPHRDRGEVPAQTSPAPRAEESGPRVTRRRRVARRMHRQPGERPPAPR